MVEWRHVARDLDQAPEFCESASTSAACGNVIARSSGSTWKRSALTTRLESWFGSRKLRRLVGVANTARLCASSDQATRSSAKSSSSSLSVPASVTRFLNSIRAWSASCGSGLVGR